MKKVIYAENNGLRCTLAEDGCYYPDLGLPEGNDTWVGKYGILRKAYLQAHREHLYTSLCLTGELTQHLCEVDEQAQEQVDVIVSQMAKVDGCNEELKAKDPMHWVGLMNSYKACAEEVVLRELFMDDLHI